jgi:hypothetical protein
MPERFDILESKLCVGFPFLPPLRLCRNPQNYTYHEYRLKANYVVFI